MIINTVGPLVNWICIRFIEPPSRYMWEHNWWPFRGAKERYDGECSKQKAKGQVI